MDTKHISQGMNEARHVIICNIDEFLLVVQKWGTESATVMFVLRLADDSNEPIFGFRLRGRMGLVDKRLPFFTFLTADESEIVVDLSVWSQIGYADSGADPKGEPVKEGFVIARPGALIAVWVPES
ncbi:MAG: hypothetical protein P4N24_18415 [Acidobacteriota bacterium]|nr:hypothetical protein [Acidobacteriota bacterium]